MARRAKASWIPSILGNGPSRSLRMALIVMLPRLKNSGLYGHSTRSRFTMTYRQARPLLNAGGRRARNQASTSAKCQIDEFPSCTGAGKLPGPAIIMVPDQTPDQISDPAVARMPVTSLVPNQADIELFT